MIENLQIENLKGVWTNDAFGKRINDVPYAKAVLEIGDTISLTLYPVNPSIEKKVIGYTGDLILVDASNNRYELKSEELNQTLYFESNTEVKVALTTLDGKVVRTRLFKPE